MIIPIQRYRLPLSLSFSSFPAAAAVGMLIRLVLPHPDKNTTRRHHRSAQPPQPPHGFAKDNHPQNGRDEEVGRGVGDGDLGCRGRGRQGAGEQGPHGEVAEEVEGEADLLILES